MARAHEGPVLVTGGTGFIAAHVVQQLLAEGYVVRTTVRKVAEESKYAFLKAFEGAEERLSFYEGDLNRPESFAPAVDGCTYVIHVASPYILNVRDAQRDLVDPAVKGTTGILELAKATPTVRRVVITSSLAAVADCFNPAHTYSEADWNEDSSLTRNPYYYSKTLAERAAHEFVATQSVGFDVVSINPGIVLGPHLSGGVNESVALLQRYLSGDRSLVGIIDLSWLVVDVRDVAEAHVRAIQVPTASGRYITCYGPVHLAEILDVLREAYPQYRLPTMRLPNWMVKFFALFEETATRDYLRLTVGRVPHLDNSKIKDQLGIIFRPMRDTALDTAANLIEFGNVPRR